MRNNIGSMLQKRAYLSPEQEGYVGVDDGLRFSYRELNQRCNRTADVLAGLGVGKGDRVALLLMNGVEFVESFFAIAKLGAVVVPLNWRLVADELAFILDDSGATVLLFDTEFAETVADLAERGQDATAVRHWIQVGSQDCSKFARSYADLVAAASDEEPEIGAADDDELYIMYTSGTTGLPKGAVHTHSTVTWACVTINVTAESRMADRYLVALPLFHVGALTPFTSNVHRGVTNLVMRSFDPVRVWDLVETEKLDAMLAVPAMLNVMFQVPNRDTVDRSSLRWIMSGAAPVPAAMIQAYFDIGVPIHQVYGLTETCGPACLLTADDAVRKIGSTGKPFFHTDVRVVDEKGADVAAGEVGEVLIRGKHLMKEYWNRAEATAEAIRDGWLHSGDLASIDEEGFIYIQDRKKDMIISGGENIYPAEIENVLLSHPGIGDAAVIGVPSQRWGESPLAVIVRSDTALEASAVLEHCRGKLARFKEPRGVEFVDEIPRNPSGKILKRVLREQFSAPADE